MQYNTDFEVRKATLRKLGGDPTGLQTIYEVDLAILDKIGGGGGGLTPEQVSEIVREVAYEKVDDIKITGEDDNPRIEINNKRVLTEEDLDGVNEILESVLY